MAQIAQQDNLVIEVTTTAAALDGDTKKKSVLCILETEDFLRLRLILLPIYLWKILKTMLLKLEEK